VVIETRNFIYNNWYQKYTMTDLKNTSFLEVNNLRDRANC